jgi:predicted Zn-dependent peptidase
LAAAGDWPRHFAETPSPRVLNVGLHFSSVWEVRLRRSFIPAVIALGLAFPGHAAAPSAASGAAPRSAASVQALVDRVDIPFDTFTLANGLRVVVHEDRKAPVVAVNIWYNIGSKDEPVGRTGFAHLFEHLMFNGSENAPGDYFQYTSAIGATDLNGSTWFDRTNYFETVPTNALERALFLESDRMGHLLGAVTQETLTNQIGVVQNEKRQRDNQPFGMVDYAQLEALFPAGHPYRHDTIGSMADLSASTLDTVRDWFRSHYGPNNAVLVLAGDIDAAQARPLVERYFGDIARGPVNTPAAADVPTLPARVDRTLHDRVAYTRLYRTWVVPGLTDADQVPLRVAAAVLGGLASSRLDNALVRGEQSAVEVSASVAPFQRISQFEVTVDVKPGQDADLVSRRLDALIADFVAHGPSADELNRAVMRILSGTVQGLEQVNGKATALAEGMLYAADPGLYHRRLSQYATLTPDMVRAAMQRWLTRPVLALTVSPGAREAYEEAPVAGAARAAATTLASAPVAAAASSSPRPAAAPASMQVPGARREMPAIGGSTALDFPTVERARLSNGIQIVYARRQAVPVTRLAVQFDAGSAADPADRLGTQAMMLNLLTQGTTHLDAVQLAEAQERLGATVGTFAGRDRTFVSLIAMTPSLAPSLDLLADVIRNPAFAPGEVERIRQQQLAAIASELTQPQGLAAHALPAILYGAGHPYGRPGGGGGDAVAVRALARDDLIAFHQSWIRPDNATIFAVGDLPLAQLAAQLEARFGTWRAPARPRGHKDFSAATPAPRARIVLVDRPQSPQSLIMAGELLPAEGIQDLLELDAANDVLGGDFLARINMELREHRGWSYGARASLSLNEHQTNYTLQAPVQADRTGESIAAAIEQIRAFLTTNGVQPAELERVVESNTRQLPGQFQTSSAVLGALLSNALYRRPDDYWERIADRYRALNAARLDQAARRTINPDNLVWVVVGDAARVRPQLERLGMPIETMAPQAH